MNAKASNHAQSAQSPPSPPCTLVVFGALGDLACRLLFPALCNLAETKLLPDDFDVIGVARKAGDSGAFRHAVAARTSELSSTDVGSQAWRWLEQRLDYLQGDFDSPDTYKALTERLAAGNVLFYLATPPRYFGLIVDRLGDAGLVREQARGWRRVIVEKPFGHDFESAEALNQQLLARLSESQIYRIDHYLGKETVQNIMALRFANAIFEPLWNRDHIDHVQITVAETVGVEHRGRFYDATGALRDMVPNHLFQLLTLTAMEPPSRFDADAVRTEKYKVLEALREFTAKQVQRNTVRGQYAAGKIADNAVRAYGDAPDVAPDSVTETYAALKLEIDNWRWAGVPFYLRTGKSLARRRTEIAVEFKHAPLALFRDTSVRRLTPNRMIIHIQPHEGISLSFGAKVPGPDMHMGAVDMTFDYRDYFQATPSTGYETLIYDCMNGDATLFQRADNIEAAWRAVQPVLDAWSSTQAAPELYRAGSAGPNEADRLLQRDGRQWLSIA